MKRSMILLVASALVCAAFLFFGAPASAAEKLPYLDTSLPIDVRVADLVSRLTNEEKASLMQNTSKGVPRLGIKPYEVWNEALHGVARLGNFTVFPQAVAMASTWDPDLIFKESTAISDEAWGAINREMKTNGWPPERYLTWWSPTINMARDPRWGRTPETYGEDPFLTGKIAVAFVRGIQGNDPKYLKSVSTPKHFAANNQETIRLFGNAWVSEKSLREYYFPAFKTAVQDGGAMSVMGAYNAVNFVPCNANRWLLTDVLRDNWGFDGFVVTDCGAGEHMITQHKYAKTKDEAATLMIKAGVDVECGSSVLRDNAVSALNKGMITQDELDLNTSRLLKIRFRLGMFDPPEMIPYSKISPSVIGSPEHMELARQVSRESIVLLKNDKVNGAPMLPMNAAKIKSVTVVGPNANVLQFGDYSGEPANPPVNPLQGITAKSGGKFEVNFGQWQPNPLAKEYGPVPAELFAVAAGGARGLSAEYFNAAVFDGAPVLKRNENELYLFNENAPAEVKPEGPVSVRWKSTFTPQASGMYYFFVSSRNSNSEMFVNGNPVKKFGPLEKKKSNMKAGAPLTNDVIDEKPVRRPAALLLLEAGKSYDFEVRSISAKGVPSVRLTWVPPAKDAPQLAFDKIRNSDYVVAFMGIGQDDDREGKDRDTLDLPFGEDEYLQQLSQLNKNIVVVLINGSPLSINWINKNIAAVAEAWYPGEQGGNAIADVLFGDYNPAGRLTMTHFRSVDDLAAFDDYEVSHGRTYMYFQGVPIYPFGFGLSYTTFGYDALKLNKDKVKASDTIDVTFKVKNTGGMDGDEVAQLYVRDVDPKVQRPIKRLRGFKRVNVKSGQSATVTIPLALKDIAYWDEFKREFVVEPGKYEVLVGASSADIRLKAGFTVTE